MHSPIKRYPAIEFGGWASEALLRLLDFQHSCLFSTVVGAIVLLQNLPSDELRRERRLR